MKIEHYNYELTPFENIQQNAIAEIQAMAQTNRTVLEGLSINGTTTTGNFYKHIDLTDYIHDTYGTKKPACVMATIVMLFNRSIELLKELVKEIFSIDFLMDFLTDDIFDLMGDTVEGVLNLTFDAIDVLILDPLDNAWDAFENIVGDIK